MSSLLQIKMTYVLNGVRALGWEYIRMLLELPVILYSA